MWALSTSSFGHFKFLLRGRWNTFTFSSWILQGAISLSWKTQQWHVCMETLLLQQAAIHQPSPDWPADQEQHTSQQWHLRESGAACSESFSLLKRESSSLKLQVAGSLPGLLQYKNSQEGAATPRSRDPSTTSYSRQHKTWPLFPDPHQGHNGSWTSITLLFIFVPSLGIWFLTFENSSLSSSFPSGLSSQCLIVLYFQTWSPFPFQPLF